MRNKHYWFRFIDYIPIRWRLALVSLGLLALLLSALGVIISVIAEQVLVTNEVGVLRSEAQVAMKGVVKGMSVAWQDRPFDLGSRVFPSDSLPSDFKRTVYPLLRALDSPDTNAVILTSDGHLYDSLSTNNTPLYPQTIKLSPQRVIQIINAVNPYVLVKDGRGRGQLVVFIPLTSMHTNAPYTIGILQLSTPTTPIDTFLAPFRQTVFWGIICTLCLAVALTFPLVGLALRPLVEIERTSQRIARGELSRRIEPPLTDDEIGRLARSFNHMVAQLEAAFKRQKRFVADVSHELRTPLTALSGSLEMLLIGADRGDAEASRRLARGMYSEVQRMHRMVEDLLVLTRLDEGKIQLRKERVVVDALIEIVSEQAQHLAQGQQFVSEVAPTTPAIRADSDRLQQVLLNIVDNALKFTPSGGRVELRAGSRDSQTVTITISDTGQGIPAKALPHIFDRFYRADPARTRPSQRAGGSGLGLAIARELVEAQGGTIAIASQPGQGTTVTITFPALKGQTLVKRLAPKSEI